MTMRWNWIGVMNIYVKWNHIENSLKRENILTLMFGLYAIIWIIVNLLIIILFNFSQTRLSKTRKQVLTVTFWDIFIIVSLYFHILFTFYFMHSCFFLMWFYAFKEIPVQCVIYNDMLQFFRSGKNMLLKYNEDPWHYESYFQDEMKIIWVLVCYWPL